MDKYPDSKEAFEVMVRARMEERNESFVVALYHVLDECHAQKLEETGTVLTCRRGCSLCCHQLVTITSIEWEAIELYLRPRTREAKDAARKTRQTWGPYWRANQLQLTFDRSGMLDVLDDWKGKPCVFLGRNSGCTIYPVCPIDCRTYTSTIRCEIGNQPGVVRFRFDCETWANNLIIEEGVRIGGQAAVVPLPHWVMITYP